MDRETFFRYQEETFDAFCKRVIRNTGIDEKRKAETRERRESSLSELPEEALFVAPSEFLPAEEFSSEFVTYGLLVTVHDRHMAASLRLIHPSLRDILLLYYFCDMNMQQISKLTGIPVSTVDYRHKQGIKRLRREMEAIRDE